MGPVTKLVSSGIGLTKEYQAHRSRSKSPQFDSEAPQLVEADNSDDEDILDTDKAQWALDDAQPQSLVQQAAQEDDRNDVDKILTNFFASHRPPPYQKMIGDHPLPIIISQKRPGSKLHGFIHAYPPVLEGNDIDQQTWFEFLDGFAKAIKYSPTFHVINASVALAAMGVTIAAGPMLSVHAAAWALHVSIEAARRGYGRCQSNKYLDVMNEKLFKPRGLYAMVFAYKPLSHKAVETVDAAQAVQGGIMKRVDRGGKLSGVAGETHHDWELRESAPLVFPELDKEQGKVDEGNKEFLREYYNRRARAKFEHENPKSKLSVLPKEEFASRFSNPTHPANNGNIVNLVTGGKIDRPNIKERRAIMRGLPQGKGRMTPAEARRPENQRRGGVLGAASRKMHEDVVYLMVVNLPSDEEMQAMRAEMDERKIVL